MDWSVVRALYFFSSYFLSSMAQIGRIWKIVIVGILRCIQATMGYRAK